MWKEVFAMDKIQKQLEERQEQRAARSSGVPSRTIISYSLPQPCSSSVPSRLVLPIQPLSSLPNPILRNSRNLNLSLLLLSVLHPLLFYLFFLKGAIQFLSGRNGPRGKRLNSVRSTFQHLHRPRSAHKLPI